MREALYPSFLYVFTVLWLGTKRRLSCLHHHHKHHHNHHFVCGSEENNSQMLSPEINQSRPLRRQSEYYRRYGHVNDKSNS
jgi:hypothetical protein